MASSSDVGHILDSRRKASIEWEIPNYFQYCQKADTFIESPAFHFANASWCLRIYPNGERLRRSVEWMGLYLLLLKSEDKIPITSYRLGIKSKSYADAVGSNFTDDSSFTDDLPCEVYCQNENKFNFCELRNISGFPFFIPRAEALANRSKITLDGMLTIFCIVSHALYVSGKGIATVSACDSCSLSLDLHKLLHSEQKSDVTIKVKSQRFRAHKLILGARSSVFAAMFEHNMKENSSGMVNIEDCDPDIFQDFLLFIYTGRVKTLSSKNAPQLFVLSDKYDLSDLKEVCVHFMINNLDLDIVCDVMAVADKHNKEDLRAAAKVLIISKIRTLLPTQQFIKFMRENPLLASEVLITVLPGRWGDNSRIFNNNSWC